MILKSTHFFQSLALGAEGGGGGCERDSTVHIYARTLRLCKYEQRTSAKITKKCNAIGQRYAPGNGVLRACNIIYNKLISFSRINRQHCRMLMRRTHYDGFSFVTDGYCL